MALTMKWFGLGVSNTANAAIDWDTDTFKAALVLAAWTPNQDTDQFWSTPQANELATGNGYTTGGIALTTKVRSYDTATNETRFDADDLTWNFTASKTFQFLVIYKVRGGASSADELVGWGDFGSSQTTSTDFTVTWASTGIFKITAA